MDSGFGSSQDRISKLPDTVLCHILSFLPTKHAVGTTVLSTRWRYLWTTVPIFDFDGTDLFLENAELSEDREEEINSRFEHFVNRVLLLSEAPSFRKFHLRGMLEDVDTWISFAIKKNVQDLKLCNLDEVPIRLPHTIFTSKTLSVLNLTGVLLNVCHSVWLPSLKILNLDAVNYESGDTMQILLSGCPVVEELYLNMWIGSISNPKRVLKISVSTLKRLTLFYLRDNFEGGFKLVLETPKLECLTLIDHVSEEFFLRNLKSLSKASIMVGPTNLAHNSSGDGLHVYNLLNGMSRVQFLDARFSFQIDIDDYLLPTFQNLTQLTFGGILNFKLLADLLHCSPILEVLILEVNLLDAAAIKSWDPPKQVPSCFLSSLNEIQIKELHGKGHELEMIEYFLQNANGLAKMTLGYSSPYDCFCKELLEFRRKSKTCQLCLYCLKHCGVVEPRGG